MTELIVGNPHQLKGRNLTKIVKGSGRCKTKAIEIWGYFVLKNLAIWSFQRAVGSKTLAVTGAHWNTLELTVDPWCDFYLHHAL